MDWIERTAERRAHPAAMWPGARGAIVLGASTMVRTPIPWRRWSIGIAAAISVYAQGDDYHELIKKRLKALARWLVAETGCELKVFVDTAP